MARPCASFGCIGGQGGPRPALGILSRSLATSSPRDGRDLGRSQGYMAPNRVVILRAAGACRCKTLHKVAQGCTGFGSSQTARGGPCEVRAHLPAPGVPLTCLRGASSVFARYTMSHALQMSVASDADVARPQPPKMQVLKSTKCQGAAQNMPNKFFSGTSGTHALRTWF